jgi:hypothetical protein
MNIANIYINIRIHYMRKFKSMHIRHPRDLQKSRLYPSGPSSVKLAVDRLKPSVFIYVDPGGGLRNHLVRRCVGNSCFLGEFGRENPLKSSLFSPTLKSLLVNMLKEHSFLALAALHKARRYYARFGGVSSADRNKAPNQGVRSNCIFQIG